MADTAHTPTPWVSENEYSSPEDGVWILAANIEGGDLSTNPSRGLVALATSPEHGEEAEALANAAHIVKCVNENEALHKRIADLEAALREIYGSGNGTGMNPQLKVDIAGAALAKAGEA